MNGKGSRPRPLAVPRRAFSERWDDTFGEYPRLDVHENEPVVLFDARGGEVYLRKKIGFRLEGKARR